MNQTRILPRQQAQRVGERQRLISIGREARAAERAGQLQYEREVSQYEREKAEYEEQERQYQKYLKEKAAYEEYEKSRRPVYMAMNEVLQGASAEQILLGYAPPGSAEEAALREAFESKYGRPPAGFSSWGNIGVPQVSSWAPGTIVQTSEGPITISETGHGYIVPGEKPAEVKPPTFTEAFPEEVYKAAGVDVKITQPISQRETYKEKIFPRIDEGSILMDIAAAKGKPIGYWDIKKLRTEGKIPQPTLKQKIIEAPTTIYQELIKPSLKKKEVQIIFPEGKNKFEEIYPVGTKEAIRKYASFESVSKGAKIFTEKAIKGWTLNKEYKMGEIAIKSIVNIPGYVPASYKTAEKAGRVAYYGTAAALTAGAGIAGAPYVAFMEGSQLLTKPFIEETKQYYGKGPEIKIPSMELTKEGEFKKISTGITTGDLLASLNVLPKSREEAAEWVVAIEGFKASPKIIRTAGLGLFGKGSVESFKAAETSPEKVEALTGGAMAFAGLWSELGAGKILTRLSPRYTEVIKKPELNLRVVRVLKYPEEIKVEGKVPPKAPPKSPKIEQPYYDLMLIEPRGSPEYNKMMIDLAKIEPSLLVEQPKLPEVEGFHKQAIEFAKRENLIAAGSYAGKTLVKGARPFGDIDILAEEPKFFAEKLSKETGVKYEERKIKTGDLVYYFKKGGKEIEIVPLKTYATFIKNLNIPTPEGTTLKTELFVPIKEVEGLKVLDVGILFKTKKVAVETPKKRAKSLLDISKMTGIPLKILQKKPLSAYGYTRKQQMAYAGKTGPIVSSGISFWKQKIPLLKPKVKVAKEEVEGVEAAFFATPWNIKTGQPMTRVTRAGTQEGEGWFDIPRDARIGFPGKSQFILFEDTKIADIPKGLKPGTPEFEKWQLEATGEFKPLGHVSTSELEVTAAPGEIVERAGGRGLNIFSQIGSLIGRPKGEAVTLLGGKPVEIIFSKLRKPITKVEKAEAKKIADIAGGKKKLTDEAFLRKMSFKYGVDYSKLAGRARREIPYETVISPFEIIAIPIRRRETRIERRIIPTIRLPRRAERQPREERVFRFPRMERIDRIIRPARIDRVQRIIRRPERIRRPPRTPPRIRRPITTTRLTTIIRMPKFKEIGKKKEEFKPLKLPSKYAYQTSLVGEYLGLKEYKIPKLTGLEARGSLVKKIGRIK